jgi:hypothetical protein
LPFDDLHAPQLLTVEAAEAEGLTMPRAADVEPLPTVFRSLASRRPNAWMRPSDNTPERNCVEGFDIRPIRSGEFVIGGNLGGDVAMMHGDRGGKVWWLPMHQQTAGRLVVRGTRLGDRGDTIRYVTSNVAFNSGGRFFPSGIAVPDLGRWLMVATSGTDWGCFILSVR